MFFVSDGNDSHYIILFKIIEHTIIANPQFPLGKPILTLRFSSSTLHFGVPRQEERNAVDNYAALVFSKKVKVLNRAVRQPNGEIHGCILSRQAGTPGWSRVAPIKSKKSTHLPRGRPKLFDFLRGIFTRPAWRSGVRLCGPSIDFLWAMEIHNRGLVIGEKPVVCGRAAVEGDQAGRANVGRM